MRRFIIAAAVLAASTGVASAVCMNPYSGMATGDDCSVSRDNWNSWYSEHYTVVDTNQDGYIGPDEWKMAYPERAYEDVDRDQNGMVSPDEWQQGYDDDFNAFDTDKNGTLSQEELQGKTQKGS